VSKPSIITFEYQGKRYTATIEETPTEYKVTPHQMELIALFGDESTIYKGVKAFTAERGSPEFDYLNAIAKRLFTSNLFL